MSFLADDLPASSVNASAESAESSIRRGAVADTNASPLPRVWGGGPPGGDGAAFHLQLDRAALPALPYRDSLPGIAGRQAIGGSRPLAK